MRERSGLNLKHIWLLISAFSLMLPVFMPSSANPQNFLANVIGTVTVAMFILSFPSSLFGLPLLFFASIVLNVEKNSIEGLYLNLLLLFVLGFIQWFWIVPRLWRNESQLQMLNLFGIKTDAALTEADFANIVQPFDTQGKTPLEKVFREENDR